jgi:hypothetical protein
VVVSEEGAAIISRDAKTFCEQQFGPVAETFVC